MVEEDGSPGLEELRRDLEAVGMVVVPFRGEIHVRRSTLEYIKVRLDRGVLHCESCVGMMSQARTTWALLAVEAIAIPAFLFQFGTTSIGLMAAFTGLIGFGFHALRYTLAELAVGRIQSVWLALAERHRLAPRPSRALLSSPATQELPAGQPPAKANAEAAYVRMPQSSRQHPAT
jgi:hypothetical protein